MSRNKKILIILLLIFVGLIYIFSQLTTTYKFAIKKKDYKTYFGQEYKDIYFSVNSASKKYSTLTEFQLPNIREESQVQIEHLVKVNNNDLEIIEDLTDTNHFFTALDFKNVDIISVKVENYYGDKKVKTFNEYIYTKTEDEERQWKVTSLKNTSIDNQTGDFVYVMIGKFPDLQKKEIFQVLVPKKLWFTKKMKQKVEVTYIDINGTERKEKYEFDLYWTKWWTIWDSFLSVT